MYLTILTSKKCLKVFITLVLVVIFFSAYWTKVWRKYQNKATTFTTKRLPMRHNSKEWPAVTICIENAFKASILKSYANTARRYIFKGNSGNNETIYPNNLKISLPELFYKAAYKLDRDFSLVIFTDPDSSDTHVNVTIGQNPEVFVEEFPTIENGLCYSLFDFNNVINSERIAIGIIPTNDSKTAEYDEATGVTLYLTSKNTRHNLVMDSWPYVDPFTFQRKFGFRSMVWMKLHQTQWKFYGGNPSCIGGCKIQNCINQNIFKSDKCLTQCIPIILKIFYKNSTLDLCEKPEENFCMYQQFWNYFRESQKYENCERPKNDIQYTARVRDGQYLNMPNPSNSLFISLAHTSKHETIKEEIRIYDTASLIGSLGGTLGLFVGFSFLGVLNYLLDRLFTLKRVEMGKLIKRIISGNGQTETKLAGLPLIPMVVPQPVQKEKSDEPVQDDDSEVEFLEAKQANKRIQIKSEKPKSSKGHDKLSMSGIVEK